MSQSMCVLIHFYIIYRRLTNRQFPERRIQEAGDLREGYRIASNLDSRLSEFKSRESVAASAPAEPDDAEVDEFHSEDCAAGDEESRSRKCKSEADEFSSAAISSSKAKKTPKTKKEKVLAEPKQKAATSTASRGKKNSVK